jgi:hypothetical protein
MYDIRLSTLTIICSTSMLIYLAATFALNYDSTKPFPTVSDLIRLHMFDRVFMGLSSILCFYCFQLNHRAALEYLELHDNELFGSTGVLVISTMPLIGVFDNYKYVNAHYILAFLFFTSICIYSTILSFRVADIIPH